MELGDENQLSKTTYFAGNSALLACFNNLSITAVPFCIASWRRLYLTALLSTAFASFPRFFLLSVERSTLLTGRKVFLSDQPNVSIRKPNLYACLVWANTFARSSTFLERFRWNMESSMIKTFARSFESRGTIASWMNGCKTYLVNLNHFNKTIDSIFCKRRNISTGKQIHIHASVGKN